MDMIEQRHNNYEKLYKDFDSNFKRMQNEEDFDIAENFLALAEKIINLGESDGLILLLKYYKDEEYDFVYGIFGWVQESLRHIIEKFGKSEQDYIEVVINNLHVMFPEGKDWAMCLVSSMINNQNTRNLILKNFNSDNKYLITTLNMIIEEFDYKYAAQIVKDQLMNKMS